MTEKRYYLVKPVVSSMTNVVDRHHPDNVVAYCLDEMKAELIMWLLNDSWDKARKRSE
ncbi:MAG: hypothetical protein RR877_10180 [Aurantimicrobium sp.]|uniref:hypothetical protein n=1 Tax=Aurantimicrobium sp. TaxID=1930784 RepID=UPI002FCBA73C